MFCLKVSANTEKPQALVETIFSQAKNIKIATDTKTQKEINKLINFTKLAENSLGKKIKSISKNEFSWYAKTLKEIIIKTVYPEAPNFLKQVKITYEQSSKQGKDIVVNSVVTKKGEETEVSYHLHFLAGGWKVFDISIDGDSWTENIKDQVISAIKKHKWIGLKKKLNKRLKELKTTKK